VVEGEGVWTVVNGDSIRMSRGDFLPQGGWNWHAHHNAASQPMAWIDGLDIPFAYYTESQFFEHGRLHLDPQERAAPSFALRAPLGPSRPAPCGASAGAPSTPLLAYRWVDTDRALTEQLALEAEGCAATVSPGHAAVRYTNPSNGRDVLPTIRCEMHRVACGASTRPSAKWALPSSRSSTARAR
jgi:gentisate 1,2-dioxygenase